MNAASCHQAVSLTTIVMTMSMTSSVLNGVVRVWNSCESL